MTNATSWNPTEGEAITLICDVKDGRPINDIKKVTWNKGDKTLTTSSHIQLSDNKLIISSLDHTLDDGHYSCAAENEVGRGDFSARFHLLVNCKSNKLRTILQYCSEGTQQRSTYQNAFHRSICMLSKNNKVLKLKHLSLNGVKLGWTYNSECY